MKIYLRPYHMKSKSARQIAEGVGALRIKKAPESSYVGALDHFVVNWGSTAPFNHRVGKLINPPAGVRNAANKISTFKRLAELNIPAPDWTKDRDKAQSWVGEGSLVIARDLQTGSAGRGITVYENQEVGHHKYYTRYIPPTHEWRIHAFDGDIISVAEKLKKRDFPGQRNSHIRTHKNGWVFCRHNITPPPPEAEYLAQVATTTCGLNFAGVDLIQARTGGHYILELNSAPGLEASTLRAYIQKIKEVVEIYS